MPLIKILEGRQSIPEITHIYNYNDPDYIKDGDVNLSITGYSFGTLPRNDVDNNIYEVYIVCNDSTSMFNKASTVVDYFSKLTVGEDRSLAALFPAFTGFPTTFTIESENTMTVYIPTVYTSGCFDIILLNRAGYTSAASTLGSYACTEPGITHSIPRGLLEETGDFILEETGDHILEETGEDGPGENPRFAGNTSCD
jgi:hypothetical protein